MSILSYVFRHIRIHFRVIIVLGFSFLRLRNRDLRWYQFWYPTILLLIVIVLQFLYGDKFEMIDRRKIISDINDLMGVLFGFYVAALAAVSSFAHKNLDMSSNYLDKNIQGSGVTLRNFRQGKTEYEPITRRRFILILFGYCATLSIFLYFFGLMSDHIALSQQLSDLERERWDYLGELLWYFYLWIILSLFVTTLLGLYYLVDRMHRS